MVIHPYAKIWCAYVKEQRQSCQSQIHGENIISILMSKVKIIQRSWMYGTHCEMVINSSAKHSTTMSKDTRNRSKGQYHIGIMNAWHIVSWWYIPVLNMVSQRRTKINLRTDHKSADRRTDRQTEWFLYTPLKFIHGEYCKYLFTYFPHCMH